MKVGIIFIKKSVSSKQINIHKSIKGIFPSYDVYPCPFDIKEIINLYNSIKSKYKNIFITENCVYETSQSVYPIKYYPLDYIGGDSERVITNSDELFNYTYKNNNVQGFNTQGYIKSLIDINNLQPNDFLLDGGIFVFLNRVQQNVPMSNVFISSSLLEIIQKVDISDYYSVIKTHKTYLLYENRKTIDIDNASSSGGIKNIVLITSCMEPPLTPLIYCNTRSLYTREERFNDTKKSVLTVKNKIPNCMIILVESCELTMRESEFFETNVDVIINLAGTKDIHYTNSANKSLGEVVMTLRALEYVIDKEIQFDNFYKLSGRYWLNNNFDLHNFNTEQIVARQINNNTTSTVLYKIPEKFIDDWCRYLCYILNNSNKYMYSSLEHLFCKFLGTYMDNTDIKYLNNVGVEGLQSVNGVFHTG